MLHSIARHTPLARLAPERARRLHLVAARSLLGAVGVQIGLGVIALPVHAWTGLLVGALALLVAGSGMRAGFSPSTTGLSVAALLLACLQGALIALSDAIPLLGILHVIDGFVLLGVAIVVAIESEDEGKE